MKRLMESVKERKWRDRCAREIERGRSRKERWKGEIREVKGHRA